MAVEYVPLMVNWAVSPAFIVTSAASFTAPVRWSAMWMTSDLLVIVVWRSPVRELPVVALGWDAKVPHASFP